MSENDTAADNQTENFKAKRDKKKVFLCLCAALHLEWVCQHEVSFFTGKVKRSS